LTEIICIVGPSGAGKTTLAKTLSKEREFSFFSVGNLEREIAKQKGYGDVVEYEKAVGLQKAYVDLFPQVVEELRRIGSKTGGIVVEGVYSPQLYKMIQGTFGNQNVTLLNITTGRKTRLRRFVGREKRGIRAAKNNIRGLDRGKFEVGLNEMMKLGRQNTIKNTGSLEEAMQKIRETLRKTRRL